MTEAKHIAGAIATGSAVGIAVSAYGVSLPHILRDPKHDAALKAAVGVALALVAIKTPGYWRGALVGTGTGLIVAGFREYRGA